VTAYCTSPATLTLALPTGQTLDLMDAANGYRVDTLDLGYPDVREDMNPAPLRHGTVDLTRLFGARAVTVSGSLIPSGQGSRQQAWHALAPFLDPGARVTLTYQVDPDARPHQMTVRAAQVSGPVTNPTVSPFSVGFKAADPLAYDAAAQVGIVYPGSAAGRAYPLVYQITPAQNRVYPAGGATSANLTSNGDFTVYPLLRIYGPGTNPTVTEAVPGAPVNPAGRIAFTSGFIINAGDYIQVDCRARTAYLNGNPANNVYGSIASNIAWPYLPPGVTTTWTYAATGLGTASQLQVAWNDAYLL